MEPEVNINTICSALSRIEKVSLATVKRRADQEQWVCREVKGKGRGGKAKLYMTRLLPGDVQAALSDFSAVVEKKETLPTLAAKQAGEIQPEQEQKAYAKFELAKAYAQRMDQAGHGQKKSQRKAFIEAYNLGEAGTFPAVFRLVGQVDIGGRTIGGWVSKLKGNAWDPMCLVDKRGYVGRGKRSVTQEQAKIILGIVQSPYNVPGKPIQEIIRQAKMVMEKRGISTLSDSTYRRWLVNDWIPNNYDQWIWWREGDKGLNDKVLFDLTRDPDRIEAGDLLVADGHVLNFEVISPTTNRPKRMMLVMITDFKSSYPLGWEISDTENTEAISIALRRAIVRLGKIPKAVYIDNGRAFKGRYFINSEEEEIELKGLYKRLGILHVVIAWAYHGQSKPVERFFGIMAELERLAYSYVGTSIANKPAHMNRGEKLRRKLHEKITGGAIPSLGEAHRAVALWCDQYVNRPMGSSSKFPGRTPDEIMIPGPGVDPAVLRCLMMKSVVRLIQQRGVNVNGQWYYDPSLYGKKFKVICRYDFLYNDSVVIYHADTKEFICEAFQIRKVHPLATLMGTEADKAELQRQIEMKRAGRKQTIATAREIVESQVLPESRKRIEAAGFALGGGDVDGSRALPAPDDRPLTEQEKKKIEKQLEALECDYEDSGCTDYEPEAFNEAELEFSRLKEMSEFDRFEKLIEMEVQGRLIPREQKAFMKYFEQSSEYKRYQEHFDAHRMKMILMHDATGTDN